jgi:hypothetical protein
MTVVEMHIALDLGLQRIGSNAFDNFQSEEIDRYLNDSVTKYIKAQVAILRDSDDNNQVRIANENLWSLVKDDDSATFTPHATLPNTYTGGIPSDYYIFLSALAYDDTNWFRCIMRSPVEWQSYLPTYKNKPIFREVPVLLTGGSFAAIKDREMSALTKLRVIYIKSPATISRDDGPPPVNVDCDLPLHTHQEIVDLAVSLMVEDLMQGRAKAS